MRLAKVPLAVHAAVEAVAAVSFIATPHLQLRAPSEDARLVLRSYGALLLATSALCAALVARPGFDAAARAVALCLAFYHAWPAHRACRRLARGVAAEGRLGRTLGGPGLHVVLHVGCCLTLLAAGVAGGG